MIATAPPILSAPAHPAAFHAAPSLPSSPPPSDIPNPTSLLPAFLSSHFNLQSLAANIPHASLQAFAASPDVKSQLRDLLELARLALALRATEARRTAIDSLEKLTLESTDPIEKRRAATSLLRATDLRNHAGALLPDFDDPHDDAPSSADCQLPNADCPAPPPRPLPKTHLKPHKGLAPGDVVDQVRRSLLNINRPEPGSGYAQVEAFCDHDAALNGEDLPTDNPHELIESLEDSPVRRATLATTADIKSATAPDKADRANRAAITVSFNLPHTREPQLLTFNLERKEVSRHPACWLITAITAPQPPAPPINTS